MSITLVQGDITKVPCEAIVNAANRRLLGGGGVDGAVHRAAGPYLRKWIAERYPPNANEERIQDGEAIITPAFDLSSPIKCIIHTVGPVYDWDAPSESRAALAACYRNSIRLAVEAGVRSIAFPAISCGVFGYPAVGAACVAREVLAEAPSDLEISLVLFGDLKVLEAYQEVFGN